jgi:hypothetical protein
LAGQERQSRSRSQSLRTSALRAATFRAWNSSAVSRFSDGRQPDDFFFALVMSVLIPFVRHA